MAQTLLTYDIEMTVLFLNVGARLLVEDRLGHIVGVFQTIDRLLQRFLVSLDCQAVHK